MSKHDSPWLGPLSPRTWPTLEGQLEVDVVVVGGGICGLTVANLLAAQGTSVAVAEAGRIGRGTTGYTTGKISSQHGLIYRTLIERHGIEAASHYAEANQQAIDQIETTVADLGVDCSFERLPSYVYTTDPDQRELLAAEHSAAESIGLPATLTTEIDLPFPIELAVRFGDQAMFDVGPYIGALADATTENSGLVFENSRAVDVDERSTGVTVTTDSGEVTADKAILTTLIPFVDRSGFFARMRPSRAYGIAAKLRSGGVEAVHINARSPTRSTRPWRLDGGPGLVVVGENHPTGHRQAAPRRWGELERWTRRHFNVESFEYRWSAEDFQSVDRMPFIGRAPLMRRTYVATGFNKWGITNATAAAHMLGDLLEGRPNPWIGTFDPRRWGDTKTLVELSQLNFHVAKRFILDRLSRLGSPGLESLEPGEGGLVRVNGETVAGYREPDGHLHAVSATCTHLACTVQWNRAEKSWDCPCHGSRFSVDGRVLDGPATRPLERVEMPPED